MAVALLGHKADLGLMALGPDLWSLRAFQRAVREAGLVAVASYVSLTEVSEYAAGVPESMKQARLYPELPPEGMPAFCFYPMSKRRGERDNWYSPPLRAARGADAGPRRGRPHVPRPGRSSSSPARPASTTGSGGSPSSACTPTT